VKHSSVCTGTQHANAKPAKLGGDTKNGEKLSCVYNHHAAPP